MHGQEAAEWLLGRPGIYPRRKCNVIIVGFSPWAMLSCPIRIFPQPLKPCPLFEIFPSFNGGLHVLSKFAN